MIRAKTNGSRRQLTLESFDSTVDGSILFTKNELE